MSARWLADLRLALDGVIEVRAATESVGRRLERALREPRGPRVLVPRRAAA